MSRLVTIARFYDVPAAFCAKSALEAYGIPCFLQNDGLVRVNWHWIPMVQGIKLHTFEEHYDEAIELLSSFQTKEELESPVEAFWRRKYLNGTMAIIMALTMLPFVPIWLRKRRWHQGKRDDPQ